MNGNGNNKPADARTDKELQRLRQQNEELARKQRHAEKQAKLARKREEDGRLESALREAAVAAGVRGRRNIDYAIHILRDEVKSDPKKFDGADVFDEQKYFEQLKEVHPFLFGETTRPATTGVSGGEGTVQPPPPKPGQVTTQTASNGQFNARTATKDELAKEMARRGLRFNP